MTADLLDGLVRRLRGAALVQDDAGATDGQLLERFLTRRDEAAFEALLRRHAPMVLGLCRRLLRDGHDAEDAFQATFLIFVRKAGAIRQRESVAAWLHRAAFRAALEVQEIRRRSREKQANAMPEPEDRAAWDVWDDLRPLLDQELDRLPNKYREAVVCCDPEGKTRGAAAGELGVPEGTLSGRLTTARRMLAERLTRREVTIAGGALAAVLSEGAASGCVPKGLVLSVARAAAGLSAGAGASGKAAAIAKGALKTMLLRKLKLASALAVVVAAA